MSSIDFIKLHIASDDCLGQEDYNPSLEFDSSLFVAIAKSLCSRGWEREIWINSSTLPRVSV